MRIVLDLQACQCVSRYRGIGRYSLALAQALIEAAPQHEILVLLNGAFQEATADLTRHFQTVLPAERILRWQGVGPTAEHDPANRQRREQAERDREAFLAALQPDIVHTGSLFEGFPDSAITSIGEGPAKLATAATLYDLIPLIYREIYLGSDPATPITQYYFRKLDYVRRASMILAISEATRQEAIEHLALDPDTVVNISTAADPMFRPCAAEEINEQELRSRVGLSRPFVMYTAGPDQRKNIDGLIRGWARLPQQVRENHQLAVVCRLSEAHQASLRAMAAESGMAGDELILPGFVSDLDLVALYNLAKVFVFPSWHEGFGLPVLEAMSCGTAVLAANTSSLPEVVGREDALFDPKDPAAIAAALSRVLIDDGFRTELENHGRRRSLLFSWTSTARRALEAFEAFHRQRSPGGHPSRPSMAGIHTQRTAAHLGVGVHP